MDRQAQRDIRRKLFSKTSIYELFERAGFTDISCFGFRNNYTLDYWNRLFPTPGFLKQAIAWFLTETKIGRLRLSLNVGNLMVIARRSCHQRACARAHDTGAQYARSLSTSRHAHGFSRGAMILPTQSQRAPPAIRVCDGRSA